MADKNNNVIALSPDAAEIASRYMDVRLDAANNQFCANMLYMQRELIAAHFAEMDEPTKARAGITTRYLDAQIDGRNPGYWGSRRRGR